jgi:hypothetical protein
MPYGSWNPAKLRRQLPVFRSTTSSVLLTADKGLLINWINRDMVELSLHTR